MAYPRLIVDLPQLKKNARNVLETCRENDIDLVAVVKGVNGIPEFVEALVDIGVETIASSRLAQLRTAREVDPDIKTYALRLPMLSEVEELVECADISLNSELEVLERMNEVCLEKGITHQVILMCELGDLREGIYQDDELEKVALAVENEMDGLHLRGVGTNLGCYGSVLPTVEKMEELLERAQFVSDLIGRDLEVVSGGATTSFPLVGKGLMPKGINELRIGDGLFINDLAPCFEFEMLQTEAMVLEAEIIELKDKPSHPFGEIGVNAFNETIQYEDKGIRKRALIALGRQDIGDYGDLRPLDEGIEAIGGSSDHTIIDLTESSKEYRVGDVIRFHLMYEPMMMCTQSAYVEKVFQ